MVDEVWVEELRCAELMGDDWCMVLLVNGSDEDGKRVELEERVRRVLLDIDVLRVSDEEVEAAGLDEMFSTTELWIVALEDRGAFRGVSDSLQKVINRRNGTMETSFRYWNITLSPLLLLCI